ncbi:hydroxymethylglutaryl-CoA synthase family protein [Haliangium ochraceum]|uniref:Hydroxymethylglutaryl-CoA synthase n=1 Tax=Haliangium ochraceum (strain DSM 14365 / JCM 11303 / SMP-2) TaxID=502025 RepID=D0LNI5_HALO1|nr:hydroxymethylglutaryl-CoA synthase [Haliangium ochraceum]ACY16890.1 Hydroxymethylglutaryl-CoA synthase [Haliangium ochraceum DSM 14365]
MTTSSNTFDAGIAAIGLKLPPLAMRVEELAALRGVDPNKYTKGLGCGEFALCPAGYGVVQLATGAAQRALERWGGSLDDIGLLAVGTESAVDMSRPLSAFVAQELELRGDLRSYEVKHACYGGTLALRQALEWRLSGASRGKAALVIAADVSLYEPGDPGEATQGAGAVAMVVEAPRVAQVAAESYAFAEPAFDFWRPVGRDFPLVEGALSLDCYKRATERCFRQWVGERDPDAAFAELAAACFHVPFPKMVKKAVDQLGDSFGWDQARTAEFFASKVAPTMEWNRRCGNAYTASLWISVAHALAGRSPGARLTAFSYGSGFGSELLTLAAGPEAAEGAWRADIDSDLGERRLLDAEAYAALRATRSAA